MKRIAAMILVGGLALTACSVGEDDVKNSIRESLANQQLNVQDVQIEKQADGNMSGFAIVSDAQGQKGRMACNAHPEGGSRSKYAWECKPVIDADAERSAAESVRKALADKGEVLSATMKRKDDDNHMVGSAQVRTADGVVHTLNCTAERDATGALPFSCEEAGQPAEAPAPDAGTDAAVEEGEGE